MQSSLKKYGAICGLVLSLLCIIPAMTNASFVAGKQKVTNLDTDSALKGWWTFDGKDITGTSALDKSSSGYTGALVGGPKKTAGKLGQAFSFSGASQYVNLPTVPDYTSAVSIGAWVYTPAGSSGGTIIAKKSYCANSFNDFPISLAVNTDKTVVFSLSQGDNFNSDLDLTSSALTPNKWHYIFATYLANATAALYVDGVQVATGASNFTISTADSPWRIGMSVVGGGCGDGSPFNGLIDDARIYNRQLSANEVKQLYIQGSRSATVSKQKVINLDTDPALIDWWTFNQADISGTTLLDRVSGGINGTLAANPAKTAGKLGQALSLDGTSQYVDLGTTMIGGGGAALTLSVWVMHDSVATTQTYFSRRHDSPGATRDILFRENGGGNILLFLNGTLFITSDTPLATSTGKWTHVVATYSANDTIKFYVNGHQVYSAGNSISTIDTNSLQTEIGASFITAIGEYMKGKMDDLRIYSRALSANEVQQLYTQGTRSIAVNTAKPVAVNLGSGLVGWWTFDGKNTAGVSARTFYDLSTNANTATSSSIRPTAGKIGQAITLNGTSDYAQLKNDITDTSGSLSVWVKPTLAVRSPILVSESNEFFRVAINTDGTVRVQNFTVGEGFARDTAGTLTKGVWHHVVVTATGSTDGWTVYIDGVLQTLNNIAPGFNNNGAWFGAVPSAGRYVRIGYTILATDYFSGSIDDMRLYNRILNANEVKQLYRLGQ